MNKLHLLGAAPLAAGLLALAMPAAADPFEVEGVLSEVQTVDNGLRIRCNGADILVPTGTPINSPTKALSASDLTDENAFPAAGTGPDGQPRKGFRGGTCIVEGDDTGGINQATSVFVELAENVLVGTGRRDATDQYFSILGVPVVPLTDSRMPASRRAVGLYERLNGDFINNGRDEQAHNAFGFGVDLSQPIPAGLSSAEGYLGTDGKLYAHTIETDSGVLLNGTTPRASVQRAQCRNRDGDTKDSVEVLGSCILPPGMDSVPVQIWGLSVTGRFQRLVASNNPPNPPTSATATCVRDEEALDGFGTFRYSNSRIQLGTPPTATNPQGARMGGQCPAQIGARLTLNPASPYYDLAPTDAR